MKRLLFSCLALTLAVNGTIRPIRVQWRFQGIDFDVPREEPILELGCCMDFFDHLQGFRKFRGVANTAFNLESTVSMLKQKIDAAREKQRWKTEMQLGKNRDDEDSDDEDSDDEQLLQNTGINYDQDALLTNASRILTDIVNSCDQASSNLLPAEWPSEEVSAYVKKREDWALRRPYVEFTERDSYTHEPRWDLRSILSELAKRIVEIIGFLDRWSVELGLPATEVRGKFHDALRELVQFAPYLREHLRVRENYVGYHRQKRAKQREKIKEKQKERALALVPPEFSPGQRVEAVWATSKTPQKWEPAVIQDPAKTAEGNYRVMFDANSQQIYTRYPKNVRGMEPTRQKSTASEEPNLEALTANFKSAGSQAKKNTANSAESFVLPQANKKKKKRKRKRKRSAKTESQSSPTNPNSNPSNTASHRLKKKRKKVKPG